MATRLLLAAVLAWRARARRDREACRRHVGAVLAAAFPQGLDGPLVDCAPMMKTGGGFFCAIASGAGGGRFFTKAILGSSREAKVWRAWSAGAVRGEGRHYRLEPPVAVAEAGPVMVLAFAERGYMRTDFRKRDGIYARNVRRVVRAVAEFNAVHRGLGAGVPVARGCRRLAVPGVKAVEAALGVEAVEAAAIVRRLTTVEAGWDAVGWRLDGLAAGLGHMDLGPSNIVMHEGRGVLMDFGHAGLAPLGADLHVVRRYGGLEEAELLDLYGEAFAGDFDRAGAELALRAHFAGRYRNLKLRSARDPEVFGRALEMSEELLRAPG